MSAAEDGSPSADVARRSAGSGVGSGNAPPSAPGPDGAAARPGPYSLLLSSVPALDGTAVAECWGGEVGVMADGCILLMPAGGRLLGGPPTKGDHHVAITCADDRGHDAGRVGPRDAAGLHPGGTPIGCALPAFAGPAQRGRGAGLPARLAPGRGSPRHVQDQPVRAAFPLLPYA